MLESDSTIGARVRRNVRILLAQRGWTQADLYRRMGVTRQAWSGYFQSPNGPQLATLERISNALDTTVTALVEDVEGPTAALEVADEAG